MSEAVPNLVMYFTGITSAMYVSFIQDIVKFADSIAQSVARSFPTDVYDQSIHWFSCNS